jgi:hypothetical protein
MSRSVQIWVMSNLWWERRGDGDLSVGGYCRMLGGGRWVGVEMGLDGGWVKCVFPTGALYFVMAWAEALRREWSSC